MAPLSSARLLYVSSLLFKIVVTIRNQLSPDVNHGHPWFDPGPDVGADLPVGLGRLPEIAPHLLVGPVHRSLLLAGGPPSCAASEEVKQGQGHSFYFFSASTLSITTSPLCYGQET